MADSIIADSPATEPGPLAANPRGLVLTEISKSWPGRPQPVLDRVSLACPPGSLTLLTGRNGAGKTTLLRIAAGLIDAEGGSARYGELSPITDRTAYCRIMGYLGVASAGLYPRLKVRHHLDLWTRIGYLPRRQRPGSIQRVVEALDLLELLDRRPDRLSMGQRQRVRLAATFLHEPTLVLLDEPTNSLDDVGIGLLRAEVERTRRGGGSLIWAHPSGEAGHGLQFDASFRLSDGKLEPA